MRRHWHSSAMEEAVRNFVNFLAEGGDADATDRAFAFAEEELGYVGPDCPPAWELLHSPEMAAAVRKALLNTATADLATLACHQILSVMPHCSPEEFTSIVREKGLQERLVQDLGRTDMAYASRMAAITLTTVAAHGFVAEVIACDGLLDAVATSVSHGLEHQPDGLEARDEGQLQEKDTVKPCMELLVALMAHSEDAVPLVAAHERIPTLARRVACTYGSHSMLGEFFVMMEYVDTLQTAAGVVLRHCVAQLPSTEAPAFFLTLRDGLEDAGRGKNNADEWNKRVRAKVLIGLFPEEDEKARDHLLDDSCS